MKPIFLEFILSHNCNQHCSYCNYPVYENNVHINNKSYTIDIKLIEQVLTTYAKLHIPMFVEFSGGEPGLATNLVDAMNLVYNYPNVIRFQILSNGLVRKRITIPDRPKLWYNEHLIYDATETELLKFYNMDYVKNQRNLVILTKNILAYLLHHPDETNYLSTFSEFKIVNNKVDSIKVTDLVQDIRSFINMYPNHMYQLKCNEVLDCILNPQKYNEQRLQCANSYYTCAIDVERKVIYQCGNLFNKSITQEINQHNLVSLYTNKLFNLDVLPKYCENCHYYYQLNYGDDT